MHYVLQVGKKAHVKFVSSESEREREEERGKEREKARKKFITNFAKKRVRTV